MSDLHEWVPSTLGHGEQMCKRCHMTNREAAVLDRLNRCEVPSKKPAAPTPLRDILTTDCFGVGIDPDTTYRVVYKVQPPYSVGGLLQSEFVSGEDLIAVADFLDTLMAQTEKDANNDFT